MALTLKVIGKSRRVAATSDTPLLYVLRNDLELNAAKFGCGLAQCGSCMVLVDGKAVRSCLTPAGSVGNAEIVTLEGLRTRDNQHPLQQAFIAEQAAHEQMKFSPDGIVSRDWLGYPILTMAEVPQMHTILIDRPDQPSLGTGEASLGPAAAAIANAFAHATGKRLRDLPFNAARVKAALA